MLPVNRLHNTAAPALRITIPSSTSKNGTRWRSASAE